MLTLLVVRHAKAENRDDVADRDRRLTSQGKADAFAIGKEVARRGPIPQAVLCSTAKRARSTARRLLQALPSTVELRCRRELYGASADVWVVTLRDLGLMPVAMIVGHNPGLEDLVAALVGRPVTLATGAVACLSLQLSAWGALDSRSTADLQWVVAPSGMDL